eukprot:Opistho-2@59848
MAVSRRSAHMRTPQFAVSALLAVVFVCAAFTPSASAIVNHAPLRRIRLSALPKDDQPCNLQCWLNKLTIHIPDQTFSLGLGATGSIKNGLCTSILIGNLDSQLVPPAGARIDATGLSIQCDLGWALNAGLIHPSGSAAATVTKSELDVTLQLQKDADGLASGASLSACTATINVETIKFSGDLSTFLDLFRSTITSILKSQLNDIICTELKKVMATDLTGLLQKVDTSIRPYLTPQVPAVPPPLPPNMYDLQHNPLVGLADYVLDDVVGLDGILGINKIMNGLTKNTGALAFRNIGLSASFPLSTLGTIGFTLLSVNVTGLNTWGKFDLLNAKGPQNLTSDTQLGNLTIAVGFGINVTASTELGNAFLHEDATIYVRLENNRLKSAMQVGVSEPIIHGLTDGEMVVPACLKSAVADLNLTQLDFSFVLAELEVLAANGGTEAQLDAAINTIFQLLTSSFQVAIPAFFNGVVGGPVRQLANTQFAKLTTGQDTCTEPSAAETFNKESTAGSFAGATGVFIVILAAGLIVAASARRRSGSRGEELREPLITEDVVVYGSNDNIAKASGAAAVHSGNQWLTALLFCDKYNLFFRFGVVFYLLLNIAMFISSNTSVGASVYVYVSANGSLTKLPSLFDFSLGNSVRDMWVAEVYALSLLIAVFSGAWPYLKLMMLLLTWTLPVNILSRRRREQMLMALDVLGKWSLIDAFVLTLMMVAFHFNIVPPVSEYTPAGSFAVNAYVEPHWGFYSFLISTMMSLTITHVVLACHRKELVEPLPDRIADMAEESHYKEALHSHAFKSNRFLAKCPRLVTYSVTGLLVLAIGLVIAGSVMQSFQFEFKGAFKLLLNFLEEDPTQSFSLVSLGVQLPDSAFDSNSFGVRFIQATWFLFAIVLPLCYLVFLLVLWLVPMTPRVQHKMFHVTEVFNAWSALEVVVVSVIAALLELQQFAQFIIGDMCTQINPLLEEYLGAYLDGDAKCFDVVTKLDSGCWLLFAACLIYIVVGLLVQLTCHKALAERESKLMLVAEEDDSPQVSERQPHYVGGGGQ